MTQDAYTGTAHLDVMEAAHNYNQFLVEKILQTNPAISLLDFGAGMGTLATAVRNHERKPICVEPDPHLNQRLKDNNHQAFSSLADVPKGQIEFAYSFNVLEHIEDDGQALREVRDILTPGGTFLLYVPAFPILYSAMDRKVGHFRRYRLAPLCRLLATQGYRVEHASHVDSLGFVAALLYKYIGGADGKISPKSLAIYDKWSWPISRLLDKFFFRMFGKNILIKATRAG